MFYPFILKKKKPPVDLEEMLTWGTRFCLPQAGKELDFPLQLSLSTDGSERPQAATQLLPVTAIGGL